MAVLVVISFVIYGVYEWFTGQHSKEIPPSITYSEQKSEEYDPTSPPILKIDPNKSRFTENTLDAMETGNLVIHIRNEGAGDANNLTIQLIQLSKDLQGLSFDSITKVPPVSKNGGEQTVKIPVMGTANLSDGKAKIGIYLVESDFEQKIPIKPLIFKTRKLPTPQLVLGDSAVNERKSASPNNRIDLNEEIELKFHVRNIGAGVAKEVNVKVNVKNEQTAVRLLEKTDETKNITRTFSEIKPGGYQTITYNYFINSQFTERELIFEIIGTEKQGKYGFSETKEFSIDNRIGESGEVNPDPIDDEAELHESPQVEELPPLKSSGNTRWIILIVFCGGLFIIIIWKRLRRGKQTTQKVAYEKAAGRKERFK